MLARVFATGKAETYESGTELNGIESFFHNTMIPQYKESKVVSVNVFAWDITELRQLNNLLEYKATHDFLTGLTNRYYFEEAANKTLDYVRESQSKAVLCYLDLDQFKIVNDTCGHIAGDELLTQLCCLFNQEVDSTMTLSRLGGDEFAILMRDKGIAEALPHAERIRDLIEKFLFTWNDKVFHISVSIGLAEINITSKGYSEVLKAADVACYSAKEAGRNQVHVYSPVDRSLKEKQADMGRIHLVSEAVDRDKLTLFYQKIISNHESKDTRERFEVLLRLPAPDNGFILPAKYIQAAERFDLMPKLDLKILETVVKQFENKTRLLDNLDFMTVNLSARSISRTSFLEKSLVLLEQSRIPRKKIQFEITETGVMSNMVRTPLKPVSRATAATRA